MEARIKNLAALLPEATAAMMALGKISQKGANVPGRTLELIHLRVSQINGCSVCLDGHARILKKEGESDVRLFTLAAWRESPYFTDAERAALALAEAATRIADRPEAVSDEIWKEAARHYDEAGLALITLNISMINFFNRINVTTRQIAGSQKWD